MFPRASSRRAAAWFLLASLFTAAAPFAGPHHDGLVRDADFDDVALSGHPKTQFEPVVDPVAPDHCVACHLQRALHTATPTTVRFAAPSPRREQFHRPSPVTLPATNLASLPSRAPPAVLL